MRSIWVKIAMVTAGSAGGYLYYYLVGCSSGYCPITSNPYVSIMYGGIVGLLLVLIFSTAKQEKKEST